MKMTSPSDPLEWRAAQRSLLLQPVTTTLAGESPSKASSRILRLSHPLSSNPLSFADGKVVFDFEEKLRYRVPRQQLRLQRLPKSR